MNMPTERMMEPISETKGAEDHDHNMVHELSNRLDALWRYDQDILNTSGEPGLRQFWRNLKDQEQKNIRCLKEFVATHFANHCF